MVDPKVIVALDYDEEKKALDDAVAGKSGDASVGPKVNEMLNADIDVDN